jgi:hypothetical protein
MCVLRWVRCAYEICNNPDKLRNHGWPPIAPAPFYPCGSAACQGLQVIFDLHGRDWCETCIYMEPSRLPPPEQELMDLPGCGHANIYFHDGIQVTGIPAGGIRMVDPEVPVRLPAWLGSDPLVMIPSTRQMVPIMWEAPAADAHEGMLRYERGLELLANAAIDAPLMHEPLGHFEARLLELGLPRAIAQDRYQQLAENAIESFPTQCMGTTVHFSPTLPPTAMPGPRTTQRQLPRYFHTVHSNTAGHSWQARYLVAFCNNRTCREPLTYESLGTYARRQVIYCHTFDQYLVEGNYWAWFLEPQNFEWVPRDLQWQVHRFLNQRFWIPVGHDWFNRDGSLSFPQNWARVGTESNDMLRHWYLIAYSRDPRNGGILPFETRQDFLRRHWIYGDVRPEVQLNALYTSWLGSNSSIGTEPPNEEGNHTFQRRRNR